MKDTNDLNAVRDAVQKEPGVMLYFYNDDCPPCISLRPKVESLMVKNFPKMELLWVNSKTVPEVPASFGVFSNPTVLVFFDGKEFRRFSKYVSIAELEQAVERYYDMVF